MLSPPGLPHSVIDLKHPCILSSDSHPPWSNARLERELIVAPRVERLEDPQDSHGAAIQQDQRLESTHHSPRRALHPGIHESVLNNVVKLYGGKN